jgi:hypothetical protein
LISLNVTIIARHFEPPVRGSGRRAAIIVTLRLGDPIQCGAIPDAPME